MHLKFPVISKKNNLTLSINFLKDKVHGIKLPKKIEILNNSKVLATKVISNTDAKTLKSINTFTINFVKPQNLEEVELKIFSNDEGGKSIAIDEITLL